MKSVPDLIAWRLMIAARFYFGFVFKKPDQYLITDFDYLFYHQFLHSFFSQQMLLRAIIAGQEPPELVGFADGEQVLQLKVILVDNEIGLLHIDEAIELLRAVPDIITRRLLIAAFICFSRVLREERKQPIADFDMLFFAQCLQVMCEEHLLFQNIFDGKEIGL
ncbi:MAG TPA: hypothetical protein VFS21_37310 [Roseiflexaceae bacterium]|nr:hypothetical protein [Roseiflexaceae bacterium]